MSLKKHLEDLEIFQAENNEQGVANVSFKIGEVYLEKGNWQTAEQYLSEAEAICRKLGNEEGCALTAIGLGDVYRSNNDPEKAHGYYQLALDFFQKQGAEKTIANLMEKLGQLYRGQGDFARALEAFGRGLDICQTHNDQLGAAHFSEQLALVYRSQDEIERALSYFQEALNYYEQARVPDRLAFVLTGVGELHHRMGQPREGLECLGRAHSIYQKLGAMEAAKILAGQMAAMVAELKEENKNGDAP